MDTTMPATPAARKRVSSAPVQQWHVILNVGGEALSVYGAKEKPQAVAELAEIHRIFNERFARLVTVELPMGTKPQVNQKVLLPKKHAVPMIRPNDDVSTEELRGDADDEGPGGVRPITTPKPPDSLDLERLCEELICYEDSLEGDKIEEEGPFEGLVAFEPDMVLGLRDLIKEIRREINQLHIRRLYNRKK